MEQKLDFYASKSCDGLDDILVIVNHGDNNVYWFDNFFKEWLRSDYSIREVEYKFNKFKKIERFDNGIVTVEDAINYFSLNKTQAFEFGM